MTLNQAAERERDLETLQSRCKVLEERKGHAVERAEKAEQEAQSLRRELLEARSQKERALLEAKKAAAAVKVWFGQYPKPNPNPNRNTALEGDRG